MRLIDADALEKIFEERIALNKIDGGAIVTIFKASMEVLLKDVKSQPTIEAKLVVHAHWIPREVDSSGWTNKFECSGCHGLTENNEYIKEDDVFESEYCQFCGAQMDEVEE